VPPPACLLREGREADERLYGGLETYMTPLAFHLARGFLYAAIVAIWILLLYHVGFQV